MTRDSFHTAAAIIFIAAMVVLIIRTVPLLWLDPAQDREIEALHQVQVRAEMLGHER